MNARTIETLEKIWPTWVGKINDFDNILIWWEMIKIYVKQLTTEISKTLNTNKYQLAKLERRLMKFRTLKNIFINKSANIYTKQ